MPTLTQLFKAVAAWKACIPESPDTAAATAEATVTAATAQPVANACIPESPDYPTDHVKLVGTLRAMSRRSGGMAFVFGKVKTEDAVTLDEFKAATRWRVIDIYVYICIYAAY